MKTKIERKIEKKKKKRAYLGRLYPPRPTTSSRVAQSHTCTAQLRHTHVPTGGSPKSASLSHARASESLTHRPRSTTSPSHAEHALVKSLACGDMLPNVLPLEFITDKPLDCGCMVEIRRRAYRLGKLIWTLDPCMNGPGVWRCIER